MSDTELCAVKNPMTKTSLCGLKVGHLGLHRAVEVDEDGGQHKYEWAEHWKLFAEFCQREKRGK